VVFHVLVLRSLPLRVELLRSTNMTYKCPVCGFDDLESAPELFTICPCCGTEFGNTDFDVAHEELRSRWLNQGAPWFDFGTQKPRMVS